MPTVTVSAAEWRRWRRTVVAAIGRRMLGGRNPDEVSREVLALLDCVEDLLGEKVLNYSVRGAR